MSGQITHAWAKGDTLYLRAEWPGVAETKFYNRAVSMQEILVAREPAALMAATITDTISERHIGSGS